MSVLLILARHCAKTMYCVGLLAAADLAGAQTPAAPNPPTDGMQRSQRQADNVYRWIKMFAEPTRKADGSKADAIKVRPPKESGATAASPTNAERPLAAVAPSPAASAVETSVPADPAIASVAPAASAAVPATAIAPATSPAVAAAAKTGPSAPAQDEDEELTILSQPQPDIPREVRNMLGTAKVAVAFTVQPDGSVQEASVISSTHRRLNRPTLEAVGQWKFAPVRTARNVRVELEFDLQ